MKFNFLKIRVAENEKIAFIRTAWLSGQSLSAWARQILRRESQARLTEAGKPVPFLEEK